jgi:hypothetical protein
MHLPNLLFQLKTNSSRMGQTRPVQTVRFIAKNTIEENILELQKRKMELANMAFTEKGVAERCNGNVDGGADGLGVRGSRRAKARENKAEVARQRMLDLNILFK